MASTSPRREPVKAARNHRHLPHCALSRSHQLPSPSAVGTSRSGRSAFGALVAATGLEGINCQNTACRRADEAAPRTCWTVRGVRSSMASSPVSHGGYASALADYIRELQRLLKARTPQGLLFRLLLDRPVGKGAPNISGLSGFWTDPKRRLCLGEDTPTHPSQWVVTLQILTDGKWKDWRGDPNELPEWADGRRWTVEEDRSVWNLTYDENGETKLCYHCGAETEAYWQDQRLGANGVALGELANRVGEAYSPHHGGWFYSHRDGTGFTVGLEDWSYDDFIDALEGKATTKQPVPSMDTVAKDLYEALHPTEESAEELVAKFRAEVSRREESRR